VARSVLIANLGARRATAGRLAALVDVFRSHGELLEVCTSGSPEEARAMAAAAVATDAPRVWVAGGDGSIHSVLPALTHASTALGVIPWGTGNILARELGIPLNWRRAVRALLRGTVRTLDAGRANGRVFCLFAGVGFDAEVVRNVSPQLKKISGRTAFIASVCVTTGRWKPFHVKLTLDGEVCDQWAWLVVVANTSAYTGVVNLPDRVRPDDGVLDTVIVRAAPKSRIIWHTAAYALLRRRLAEASRHRAREVRVETDPPVCVQVDGELCEWTPLSVAVDAGALRVVVPASGE